jgi:hypothetical protein
MHQAFPEMNATRIPARRNEGKHRRRTCQERLRNQAV